MQAKQFDMASVTDEKVMRQLGYVSFEGMSALAPSRFADYSQAQAALNRDSKDSTICDKDVPPPCALQYVFFCKLHYEII